MNKNYTDIKLINREISWLSFNERVLQEAADKNVPLIERLKFLGIFSSNLDEFFRVRVATLKRMLRHVDKIKFSHGFEPQLVINQIQSTVVQHRKKFQTIYEELIEELKNENIFLIDEKQLNEKQKTFIGNYFRKTVLPTLTPILLDEKNQFPELNTDACYLAIIYVLKNQKMHRYAVLEIPISDLDRFILLPSDTGSQFIIMLDDIIRHNLKDLFVFFNLKSISAYAIKISRDAELDFSHDEFDDILVKVSKSLKQRKKGTPVRFTYDKEMPPDLLTYLEKRLLLSKSDLIIPSGRYQNSKDFVKFPKIKKKLVYQKVDAIYHPRLHMKKRLLDIIERTDILLHYPYHSFSHFIDVLRESSIAPDVNEIYITLYRVAKNSNIIKALINAAKNGKKVTVVFELRARFDEEANIHWAESLKEEGLNVVYGLDEYKVHSKLCLIKRKKAGREKSFAMIGTGNFNEDTAKLYCDDQLFTCHDEICKEVEEVFKFLENKKNPPQTKHLYLAPYNMQDRFLELIDYEIDEAKNDRKAEIIIKLNNFVDYDMIDRLIFAANQGVNIKIVSRSTSALYNLPNIEVISIVDKYLEHSRIIYFYHSGEKLTFLSSADWMKRNLKRRIEIATPIYNDELKQECLDILNIQLKDNIKARVLDNERTNTYRKSDSIIPIRAQDEIFFYLQNKVVPGKG